MGSYRPDRELQREIASRLPEPSAVSTLRDLGFTTLVVEGPVITRSFVKAAANTQSPIRPLHITGARAAFEILPDS